MLTNDLSDCVTRPVTPFKIWITYWNKILIIAKVVWLSKCPIFKNKTLIYIAFEYIFGWVKQELNTYEVNARSKVTLPLFDRRFTSKTIFVEKSFSFSSISSRLKLPMKWWYSVLLFGRGSVAFKFWHNWRASLCFAWPIWAKQNSLPSILTSIAFLREQTFDRLAGLATSTWSDWLTTLCTVFLTRPESKMHVLDLYLICFYSKFLAKQSHGGS